MWNGLSVFITIFQGLLALIKWLASLLKGNRRGYKEIFKEVEISYLKRRFRHLKKNDYGYKCIKGAKLLFILKDYFSREKAKKVICICKQEGYISYNKNFDVNENIIIRKEDEFVEKIINSRES